MSKSKRSTKYEMKRLQNIIDSCEQKKYMTSVEYDEFRNILLEYLLGSFPTTIEQRMFLLTQQHLFYRHILFTLNTTGNIINKNPYKHIFDYTGYLFATTTLIRSLTQDTDYISFKTILHKINALAPYITRELFVCSLNIPYEYDIHRDMPDGLGRRSLDKYDISEMRHKWFDIWSQSTSSENRTPSQTISQFYIGQLLAVLDAKSSKSENINKFTNQFICHARGKIHDGDKHKPFSVCDIEDCIFSLCNIFHLLSTTFSDADHPLILHNNPMQFLDSDAYYPNPTHCNRYFIALKEYFKRKTDKWFVVSFDVQLSDIYTYDHLLCDVHESNGEILVENHKSDTITIRVQFSDASKLIKNLNAGKASFAYSQNYSFKKEWFSPIRVRFNGNFDDVVYVGGGEAGVKITISRIIMMAKKYGMIDYSFDRNFANIIQPSLNIEMCQQNKTKFIDNLREIMEYRNNVS